MLRSCICAYLIVLSIINAEASVGKKAFYILFSDQVKNHNWPQKLCQNNGIGPQGGECVDARDYHDGIFVASPQNFTSTLVAKVKADVPGSKILMYWDFGDMPIMPADPNECPFCKGHIMGDRPGRNCTTTYQCGPSPFLTGLQQAFPTRYAVHDISEEVPGVMVESYPGLAKYVWTNATAPLLADYLATWITGHNFDGIYLDGYVTPDRIDFVNCKLKAQGCQSFIVPGHLYDINGDGKAESPEEISQSYFAWAPAFVAMLRARLGDEKVVLANAAGAISDSSLSGITIEMEACVGAEGEGAFKCANALVSQAAVTEAVGRSAVSMVWLTHSESMSPARQCNLTAQLQRRFPWVLAGTDFFDGSHVVCD